MKNIPSVPKIYKSSAGSGKTFTLVKEYLSIVLRYPEQYRNILAITFTNKAAGEMKDRIIRNLKQIASGKPSSMRDLLKEITHLPDTTLSTNARHTLSFILHNYTSFAVSTIDAFTYRIIRNFSHDLDLPGKFDVETETKVLTQRMVDQLMDSIGRNDYITRILVHFAEEKLKDESGWKIDNDIAHVANELFKEGSKAPLQTLHDLEPDKFIEFIEFMKVRRDTYPEKMAEFGVRAMEMIYAANLGVNDFKGKSRGGVATVFKKIQEKRSPGVYDEILKGRYFIRAVGSGEWSSDKSKGPEIEALLANGLQTLVDEMMDYHSTHFDPYMTAYHAYQNIHSLAVLREIEELLTQYKKQHNLVHISEFQNRISEFIQSEETDYIFWRLGERYQHFLLDEFQDTSVLQWLNLSPLFKNILSGSKNGNLLLVGDSKQAIYRWRGGEIELMEQIAPAQLNVEPHVLEQNFRSMEFVVDFNNRFFGAVQNVLHSNDHVKQIYTDFEQQVRPEHKGGGLVQLALLEGKNKSEFQETALDRTETLIKSLIVQGYQYRDIAILVRVNSDGSRIAQFLNEKGVKVISSEAILLSRAPVINFITSLFKFLVTPRDRIAQVEVLQYYFSYLEVKASPGLEESNLNALVDFFEEPQPHSRVREILQSEKPITAIFNALPAEFKQLSYQLERLPLYELAEQILQIFELNKRSQAYLQHFLDLILQYSERSKPDLAGFLEFWEEQKGKASVTVPEGENAVEIMTIHKAKGLEFPVVLLPFCNWEMALRSRHTFWATAVDGFEEFPDTYLISPKKELSNSQFRKDYQTESELTILDHVNLLYVAFTRPRERLYIYAPVWDRKRKKSAPEIEDITDVGRLLNLVMEEPGFDEAGNLIYETGIPGPPRRDEDISIPILAEEFISESWRERIRINRRFRKFWGSDSSTKRKNITTGTLMAEVLRRLTKENEVPLILNSIQEEGLIDETHKSTLRKLIDGLMKETPFKEWFAQETSIRHNREIILPNGGAYRPDRLILNDKDATVINFVDVDISPTSLESMGSYAKALESMGYGPVRAFVVFLPGGNMQLVAGH